MKPKRVLHYGLMGGIGGVETFVMNLYKHIDKEKLQFDFLTTHNGNVAFSNEIISCGGNVHSVLYSKSESLIRHVQSYNEFFRSVDCNDYVAVHLHSNFPRYLAPLAYAKKYGIKKRIYHAHSAMDMYPCESRINNLKKQFTEYTTIRQMGDVTTHFWACSVMAARYMFRGKYEYDIIQDAIDAKKFCFDEIVREKKRRELSLGDSFTIGFVGWLSYQKNPEFLLDVFEVICASGLNAKLVFVGKGNREEKLRELATKKHLENKVLFLGARGDVSELMQAFDCFVMPSRGEGLGITYIEAQAAGLHCFGSTNVPSEAGITSLMKYIDLTETPEYWANEILKCRHKKRKNTLSEIQNAGFDIVTLAKDLQKKYLEE